MQFLPFTKEQAIDICDDFEDLIGTKFSAEDATLMKIENVVVGPYHNDDIVIFADEYVRTRNVDAMMKAYFGDDFDVFVFAYPVDDKAQISRIDIRSFAELNGIFYNFFN